MKTEQEQIEKMARSMCGYCSTDGRCAVSKNGREPDICANVDTQHCLYKEYAERLIESGYGKVSEYEAEIERLKAETSNIRRETAKEILDMLYDIGIDKETLECCRIFDVNGVSLAKQICEKYGVEVENEQKD